MRVTLCIIISAILCFACTKQFDQSQQGATTSATLYTEVNKIVDLDKLTFGQKIYVPIYSHIYYGNNRREINLAATLSIRNTDLNNPIIVTIVDYYDTNGKLVRKYLNQPLQLPPMATRDYIVEEDDTIGGSGANFIVEWKSKAAVSEPVVEAVMISTHSSQGISFVSHGRVIKPPSTHANGE